MSDNAMETVVPIIIGVLATIFVAALVALLIVCKKGYCRNRDYISRHYLEDEPDNNLVDGFDDNNEDVGYNGVEMNDVNGGDRGLDLILQNDAWVNDVTGLAPHCLAILKTAHLLTDRLVSMTLNSDQQLQFPETITELVSVARRIGPRVDDVVHAMYPPLDPRLLEARCSSLVLSVSHLVLLTKSTSRLSAMLDWVDQSLADVDDHLQALREASLTFEASMRNNGVCISSESAPVENNVAAAAAAVVVGDVNDSSAV